MPYDQETTVGYFLTLTIQTFAVWKYSAAFCTINTFYIGVSRYTEAFIKDMTMSLNDIDVLNDTRRKTNSKEIVIAMKLQLVDVMKFHIEFME